MLLSGRPARRRVDYAQVPRLLHVFTPLFYVCKFLGIYPHDLDAFQTHGVLHSSRTGSFVVVVVCVAVLASYSLMAFLFRNTAMLMEQINLRIIIAVILTFFAPFIMMVDQVNAVRKQRHLGKIFKRFSQVDATLAALGMDRLHNESVAMCVRLMLGLTLTFELVVFLSTYASYVDLGDFVWIMSCIPTFFNTLDKIWFVALTLAVKHRFAAINEALQKLAAQQASRRHLSRKENFHLKSLQQELSKRTLTDERRIAIQAQKPQMAPPQPHETTDLARELTNFDAIEERFNRLCQLHCDICSLAQELNSHWSLPILCLMAYGFVITIAQLYFLYAARWDENVPSVLISAQSMLISAVYLTYLSGKCVTLMFTSWRCSLEAKKTGIGFHRYALNANKHQVYELVNHLSLKLLNHVVDFTAGGFFRLDMATLFGILGALTSYLIIFIQFDLEAKQQEANHVRANITRAVYNETQ